MSIELQKGEKLSVSLFWMTGYILIAADRSSRCYACVRLAAGERMALLACVALAVRGAFLNGQSEAVSGR